MMENSDLLDDIFAQAVSSPSLFTDRDVLRSDYVPDKLLFRETQLAAIGQTLAPLLKGARSSNLLLYGKTGTGKTVAARYVLNKLQVNAKSQGTKIQLAYCNTRLAGTEYRILYELGRELGLVIPFTGLALSEASDRLMKRISELNLHTVIILDEIDYIVKSSSDNLLYEISRSNERLKSGFITLVGISNDLQFKEFLDPRVLSSLSEEETVFPPYSAEEIKAILESRVRIAFRPDAVDEGAVNLCAAMAGMEHGDARRAVDTLRIAAEVAERNGELRLEEKHVRLAVQKIEQDRMVEALKSLPTHEKLLILGVLSGNGADSTGHIYGEYSRLCERAGIEKLTQRRISGLLSELDLMGILSSNVISQGRYGRTKKIKPLISSQLVRSVFLDDPVAKLFL